MGHFSVPLPISALCSYGLITQNDQKEYNKSSVVEISCFLLSFLVIFYPKHNEDV